MGFTNFTKALVITSASFGLAMFMACGDETTITETSGIATLKAGEKLSQCDDSNDGEMLYVADSSAIYYCADGSWNILNGKDGSNGKDGTNGNDGSNGNNGSNGKNGTNGNDGSSCTAKVIDAGIEVSCNGVVVGTLTSVKGFDGKSAYEIAAENGPVPETEEAWIASIKGTSCTAEAITDPDDASKTGFKLTCGGEEKGILWSGVDGQDKQCTMDFYDEKNNIVRLNCGSYDAYLSGYVDYYSSAEAVPSSSPSSQGPTCASSN